MIFVCEDHCSIDDWIDDHRQSDRGSDRHPSMQSLSNPIDWLRGSINVESIMIFLDQGGSSFASGGPSTASSDSKSMRSDKEPS